MVKALYVGRWVGVLRVEFFLPKKKTRGELTFRAIACTRTCTLYYVAEATTAEAKPFPWESDESRPCRQRKIFDGSGRCEKRELSTR